MGETPEITYLPPLDPKYRQVWLEWTQGKLSYSRIFQIAPPIVVAKDLQEGGCDKMESFIKRVKAPEMLTFRDIYRLARLFNIPFLILARIVGHEIEKRAGAWGV